MQGCGFVEYYDEKSTVEAVHLNGTTVHGKTMRVDFSSSVNSHSSGESGNRRKNHGRDRDKTSRKGDNGDEGRDDRGIRESPPRRSGIPGIDEEVSAGMNGGISTTGLSA